MKRRKKPSSSWMWRRHELVGVFVVCASVGFALAAVLQGAPSSQPVHASVSENVMGWIWSDPTGWISLNDLNPGSGGGSYGVNVDLATGALNGFAWSNNTGWICFGSSCTVAACSGVPPASIAPYNALYADVQPPPFTPGGSIRQVHGWAKVCNEGDQGWISLNCADVSPSACGAYPYHVALDLSTHFFEDPTGSGSPANGTSFAWSGSNDGTGIGYIDFHQASLVPTAENVQGQNNQGQDACADGIDNDLNGLADCQDLSCASAPACLPPQPALTEIQCPAGTADLCCADGQDNDGNGQSDCNDPVCQGSAASCPLAWLKTKFGNVYAQKGIDALAPPSSQFNATYCLSSTDGSITGFASESNCIATSSALILPKSEAGYRGSLGAIDVNGIEHGRYGTVQHIVNGDPLPSILDGKVYMFSGEKELKLPGMVFQNGKGIQGRGNGLLYVKGADLRIIGDIQYASSDIGQYLRNLASFGVLVTKDPTTGLGGNIIIDPSVETMAGAYFAEQSISTGATATPFTLYGLMAARQLTLERIGGTVTTAAETIVFDGRAVANPPPGMQDVGKSLPKTQDAF